MLVESDSIQSASSICKIQSGTSTSFLDQVFLDLHRDWSGTNESGNRRQSDGVSDSRKLHRVCVYVSVSVCVKGNQGKGIRRAYYDRCCVIIFLFDDVRIKESKSEYLKKRLSRPIYTANILHKKLCRSLSPSLFIAIKASYQEKRALHFSFTILCLGSWLEDRIFFFLPAACRTIFMTHASVFGSFCAVFGLKH